MDSLTSTGVNADINRGQDPRLQNPVVASFGVVAGLGEAGVQILQHASKLIGIRIIHRLSEPATLTILL